MIVAFLALYLVGDRAAIAAPPPQSILVLQQSDARGPFYNEIINALRTRVNEKARQPVSIFVENLDLSRFGGAAYDQSLQAHLRVKYSGTPIGVIVAIGQGALAYAIRTRDNFRPNLPVVFALVDQSAFSGHTLPADTTGIFMRLSFADMVLAARALVPDLSGVAIVGDVFESQTIFRHFAEQIGPATAGLKVTNLVGLPMSDLHSRLAQLPERTAILYTAIYSDGNGTFYPPSEALALIAQNANRPIVVAAETFVGRGGAGGFVLVPSVIGQQAGALAMRVLTGESASSIPPASGDSLRPIFDWRTLQRWDVDESRLPAGSEIRHRPPTAWEQYSTQIMAIAVAFVALTILVIALLQERRTRFAAELTASERMSELAHINRHATAGEMSAAIAHELNQPLGAILNNAETAAILLESDVVNVKELKTILADIRRDDERASEIIRRLRALVSKKMTDPERIDLNTVAREALGIATIQARARGIAMHDNLSLTDLPVNADAVQLQQVILNLAINAIEATDERPSGPRDVVARTAWADSISAEFLISDFGPGIPADRMNRIFEPFFTTKTSGMGMGLSLARTIIEAHGGRLWAENAITGGAVFRFRLPLVLTPERG